MTIEAARPPAGSHSEAPVDSSPGSGARGRWSLIVLLVATLSQRLLLAGFSSQTARARLMAACMTASASCFVGSWTIE